MPCCFHPCVLSFCAHVSNGGFLGSSSRADRGFFKNGKEKNLPLKSRGKRQWPLFRIRISVVCVLMRSGVESGNSVGEKSPGNEPSLNNC